MFLFRNTLYASDSQNNANFLHKYLWSFTVLNIGVKQTSSFQILAKGELVVSDASVFEAGKSHVYELTLNDALAQELAPKARIVAWYMTDTQEIISDSVDFKVDGAFSNDVSQFVKEELAYLKVV